MLAVRPEASDLYIHKPASKLINAWLAGVPALLGPEYAFRELRRSSLDYFEVSSLEDAIAAVKALSTDPQLYRAMVANGLERAKDFETDRIVELWVRALFEEIPSVANSLQFRVRKRVPFKIRRRAAKLMRT